MALAPAFTPKWTKTEQAGGADLWAMFEKVSQDPTPDVSNTVQEVTLALVGSLSARYAGSVFINVVVGFSATP